MERWTTRDTERGGERDEEKDTQKERDGPQERDRGKGGREREMRKKTHRKREMEKDVGGPQKDGVNERARASEEVILPPHCLSSLCSRINI